MRNISYYYFHRCHPALRAMAALCGHDGWRGPEALRSFQHGMTLRQLDYFGIPYTLVEGTVEERVAQVRAALKSG